MNQPLTPGVWSVLPTPFTGPDLDLDPACIARLAAHAADAGAVGLTVLGVFGEAARLSWNEREVVLRTVLDSSDLPLVVGCTGLSTAPAIEEAQMARDIVGDRLAGVMVQANSPDKVTLQTHLRAVNEASGQGIVIQDYPAVSGVSVSPAMLGDLAAELSYVVAIKAEAPPTPVAVAEMTARCDVPVFGGLGGINLLDELAAGAAGAMTGFSFPEALVACVAAWSADPAASRAALLPYLPLIAFEQQAGVALAIRKECLRRRGLIDEAAIRPPGRHLPESLVAPLADHLATVAPLVADGNTPVPESKEL